LKTRSAERVFLWNGLLEILRKHFPAPGKTGRFAR